MTPLTVKEACALVRVSRGVLVEWIRSGRLEASRKTTKLKSPYLINKEKLIAAANMPLHTIGASGAKGDAWHSTNVVGFTTATSQNQIKAQLEKALELKTKGRPKKYMIK